MLQVNTSAMKYRRSDGVMEDVGAIIIGDIYKEEETDSKYFDIDYDGLISLKPQYRGASEKSTMPYSISDNGVGVNGSKINELPERIVIPEIIGTTAVTGLQEGMFYCNRRIKSLVLPKSVTSLPANFVCRAINLESLENTEQVVNLGNTSLAYTNLKKAFFPNLKTMGTATFANSSNLAIVDIGNNITELPTGAFNQMENLSYILGGANVTKIGAKAFAIDRRLRNLSFLQNLTSIGQQAFYDSRVNFEEAYPALVANGCTFGTEATYKQINGDTDYWTGVEYTPCENPLRSLFHQKDPRWNDEYVGSTNFEYGASGCSIVTISEIYSALEQVDLDSPIEFVEILESKNIDYSDFQTTNAVNGIFTALGYDTEIITSMNSTNLKKVYDALKDGALVWKTHMIYGNNSTGHANLVYGVNGIGELLIADSGLQNHNLEQYTNHLSSMPIYTTGDSEMDCIIVKKA